MSFLDQLKKQAEQVKVQESAAEQKKKEISARFEKLTKPKMRQIYSYLYEMVEQLKLIQPNPPVKYSIPVLGEYKDLKQDEYILGGFDEQNVTFFLRVACHTCRKNIFEIRDIQEVNKMREYLWSHNIHFKWLQDNDKQQKFLRAVFNLEGEIFIEFTFRAEPETANIHLNVRNFEEFGKVDYLIPPQDVDSKFLDTFAMYITRHSEENILQDYAITQNKGKLVVSEKDKIRAQILAELAEKKKLQAKLAAAKPKQPISPPPEKIEEEPVDVKARIMQILNTKIL
jgi:curved DNA-binding protein CbpA